MGGPVTSGRSWELPEKSGKLPENLWMPVQIHIERSSGEVAREVLGSVAQCSAIGVSVAATPPCSAIRFASKFPCDTVTEVWQDRCDRVFF